MLGQSSLKLKKAIASGKVRVLNPFSGEVQVYLYDSKTKQQFTVIVGSGELTELAPKYVKAADIDKSRNLNELLNNGQLKLR